MQRLLDDGIAADLEPRWNVIKTAAVALTVTPSRFGTTEIDGLREAGLTDLDIVDIINGTAFFNWANRLMLSLGEPELPVT